MYEQDEDFEDRWERLTEDTYLKYEGFIEGNITFAALSKIFSLMLDPSQFGIGAAEHDIVYLVSIDELVPLTDEDIIYLSRCGVIYQEDSLAMHV